MVIPVDILLLVLQYCADQSTMHALGLTCRCVSPHALRQLWSMPYISTIESLNQFTATLSLATPLHPYGDWITGLAIHLFNTSGETRHNNNNDDQAPPPPAPLSNPSVFPPSLLSTKLEILSLQAIHISEKCAPALTAFITAQLDGGMSELHLYDCSPMTIGCILTSLEAKERPYLRSLYFHDCFLTDYQIVDLAVRRVFCQLQTLVLNRCGCFSDIAMLAIAHNCRQLISLVVTLPSALIQSNTITLKTIEALKTSCLSLKQFVCSGQIRISEYILSSSNNDDNTTTFHVTDSALLYLS